MNYELPDLVKTLNKKVSHLEKENKMLFLLILAFQHRYLWDQTGNTNCLEEHREYVKKIKELNQNGNQVVEMILANWVPSIGTYKAPIESLLVRDTLVKCDECGKPSTKHCDHHIGLFRCGVNLCDNQQCQDKHGETHKE